MAQRDVSGERASIGRGHDASQVEHHSVVRDRERGPRVLLNEHDRDAVLPTEPNHQVHDLRHDPWREAERRLIKQQHARACH
jgi:hypothetical protein